MTLRNSVSTGATATYQSDRTLSGVVLDELSGEPLPGAEIWLSLPGRALFPGSSDVPWLRRSPSATTDASGHFRLERLAAGTYHIGATADGHAQMAYGANAPGRTGVAVDPAAAVADSIVIRLPALASVSGVVRAVSDDPLEGISVSLLQRRLTLDGPRLLQVAEARTDATGSYVFAEVLPNSRYYVVAGNPLSEFGSRLLQEPTPLYPWTFYPSVRDSNGAAAIDVLASMRLSSIDIALEPATLQSLRGRLKDPTGQVPSDVWVTLHTILPFDTPGGAPNRRLDYSESDGTFRVDRLVNGHYGIGISLRTAFSNDVRQLSAFVQEYAAGSVYDSWIDFRLVGSGEDLAIVVPSRGSLTGHVAVPDDFPRAPDEAPRLTVGLQTTTPSQPLMASVSLQPDGSFAVAGPLSGAYRLSVGALPPGYYIADARFNGALLPDFRVTIPPDSSNTLNIQVAFGAGTVVGQVLDENRDPVSAAVGLMLPDPLPNQVGYFRFFTTDSAGAFELVGIAPRRYQLFAFSDLNESDLPDPGTLRRAGARSSKIAVIPSAQTATVVPLSAIGDAKYSGLL